MMREMYGTAREATDENIIRCMRLAYWITKAADTLRICNTSFFCTATMVMLTHLSVLFIHTLLVFKNGIPNIIVGW